MTKESLKSRLRYREGNHPEKQNKDNHRGRGRRQGLVERGGAQRKRDLMVESWWKGMKRREWSGAHGKEVRWILKDGMESSPRGRMMKEREVCLKRRGPESGQGIKFVKGS